jgi:hypothetical protein
MTFNLTNANATPLTGVAFTDNMAANAITITGAATNTCGGTLTAAIGSSLVSLTNGTIPITGCSISVPVTSATTGTKVNTTSQLTSNEAPPANPATATLLVNAVPVTATIPPTATPTATQAPPFVQPVIPQVFQHVPQGIFAGPRNNTPTPVVRAIVAPQIDPGAIPVLRPPSTGDAGLQVELER